MSTPVRGRGWHRGISPAVFLAAMMPARRAAAQTSPLGSLPAISRGKTLGPTSTRQPATAWRRVTGLSATSTILSWPVSSRWVKSLMAGFLERLALQTGQLLQQRSLSGAEKLRGGHRHFIDLVPRGLVGTAGGPGAREPEDPAGLGALGQVKGLVALQGGNADHPAQGGLGKRDRDAAVNIIAHPGEEIMGGHMDDDLQVPRGAVLETCPALAIETQAGAGGGAGRDPPAGLPPPLAGGGR